MIGSRLALSTVTALLVSVLICQPTVAANAAETPVNEVMAQAGDRMLGLLLEMNQPEPDSQRMLDDATQLNRLLNSAAPHFVDADEATAATYSMLSERLQRAQEWLPHGYSHYVRSTLGEAFDLCASCHSRDRIKRVAFPKPALAVLDDFALAEYRFLTRDYSGAMKDYATYLETADQNPRREGSLRRILTISLEIERDPALAKRKLAATLATSPSPAERTIIQNWLSALDNLAGTRGVQSPYQKATIHELATFLTSEWPALQSMMNWDAQQVWWVAIRGELNRLVRENPDESMPLGLYWLAVADRAMHFEFYDSLSRRYLEQCIRLYPAHPIASSCLREFEFLLIVSFSGSGGTNLPPEAKQQLTELRRLLVQVKKPE